MSRSFAMIGMIFIFFGKYKVNSLSSSMSYIIKTERIGLRNWEDSDLEEFTALNADPEVMRFFPAPFTKEESQAGLKKLQGHFHTYKFTYFLAEELATQEFLGFVGLLNQKYESPYTPYIDIGWRLKQSSWGKGYATEAARACLDYAFNTLGLTEIYSVTPIQNVPSESVMKKIGMIKIDEFEHPEIPEGHPLRTCVLYKIEK